MVLLVRWGRARRGWDVATILAVVGGRLVIYTLLAGAMIAAVSD
jgi:hypothetical protein